MAVIRFSGCEMCFGRHFADPNCRDIPKNHPIPKLINTGAGDGVKILAGFSYFKEAWPQPGARNGIGSRLPQS